MAQGVKLFSGLKTNNWDTLTLTIVDRRRRSILLKRGTTTGTMHAEPNTGT